MIDEIKLVEHLSSVLKDGLKGNSIDTILFANPQTVVLAGVLFPREMFEGIALPGQDDKDENETIKKLAVPLSKNCSVGLDFLLSTESVDSLKLSLDCSFDIYARIFPTYEEQRDFITVDDGVEEIDEEGEADAGDADNNLVAATSSDPKTQEFSIAEKYKKISVSIYGIDAEISLQDNASIVLETSIQAAIDNEIRRFISDNSKAIYAINCKDEKRPGRAKKVSIRGPWDNEQEYIEALNTIVADYPNLPKWQAEISVKVLPQLDGNSNERRVNVLLSNTTPYDFNPEHPQELYNCTMKINLKNAQFVPFQFENVKKDYRYNTDFVGLGINCTAMQVSTNSLITETIPSFFQDWYRTRDKITATFQDLQDKPLDILKQVNNGLNEWLSEWNDYVSYGYRKDNLTAEQLAQCKQDMADFKREIASFELGCQALKLDKRLLTAFVLMNAVFAKAGQGKYSSWRLFQLVFIVRLIPSLAARETSDVKYNEELNKVDILWFPTGGGKTEAYLGLIICALFYDRLRGKAKGTTAWLRFPLRMLSKQQLDRLARVLALAEEVRNSKEFPAEKRGEPFSMGYFVGGGNTPNFISVQEMKKLETDEHLRHTKIQLHKCPFCGSKVNVEVDQEAWRLIHKCSNDSCYTNRTAELKQSLPLYITDSEVYRYLPSVICGTVDKLAILGRYGEFTHIFGQVSGYCPKHGYFSAGTCLEKRLGSRSCNIHARSYMKVTPETDPSPSLLIQDELHLLKEELGVFDGHYEGFIQELARKIGACKPPKVLAATATIESYELHIRHLYGKDPNRYPVPSYQNGETFYATSTPKTPRRLYLGLLSHSKSSEETVARCLTIYHEAINALQSSPSEAISGLNLQSFSIPEEFLAWLAYYDLSTVYVNKKATGHNIDNRIERIINPVLSKKIGYILNSVVLTGDEDMAKIGNVIEQIEREKTADAQSKLHCLIATSLISHGVDLERINAFFMAGMPSKTAEYIQASSRSARSHAGLVMVCFNAKELRERSQYIYFIQNHKFQDKLVEPVPINRLATYSFEKTIPGLMSGLLLGVYSRLLWSRYKSPLETAGEVRRVLAEENTRTDQILSEDRIIQDLYNIIGIDKAYFSVTMREEAKESIAQIVKDMFEVIRRSPNDTKIKDEIILNPLTSFRDVDEGIDFLPSTDTAIVAGNIR
jgi:hypothetical protein